MGFKELLDQIVSDLEKLRENLGTNPDKNDDRMQVIIDKYKEIK